MSGAASAVGAADVAVFVALPEEAGPLMARLRGEPRDGGACVSLHVTGPGPGQAARAARRVLESARPGAVICAGLAGGLDPTLKRGDLLVASRVVESGGPGFDADPGLLAAARCAGAAREGRLLTASRVVGTAAEKARLRERAEAVDMESAAVARAAAEAGAPFLAIRIISDAADENFPIDLNHYMDDSGNVKRLQLAMAALGRPSTVPFLLRLRSAAKQGSEALAAYLESFFKALEKWGRPPTSSGNSVTVAQRPARDLVGVPTFPHPGGKSI